MDNLDPQLLRAFPLIDEPSDDVGRPTRVAALFLVLEWCAEQDRVNLDSVCDHEWDGDTVLFSVYYHRVTNYGTEWVHATFDMMDGDICCHQQHARSGAHPPEGHRFICAGQHATVTGTVDHGGFSGVQVVLGVTGPRRQWEVEACYGLDPSFARCSFE